MYHFILKVKFILILFLSIGSVVYSQDAVDRFIQDHDLSGFAGSIVESSVDNAIQNVLPDIPEIYRSNFRVIDGGGYYLNQFNDQLPSVFFDDRFDNMVDQYENVLYLGRTISVGGEYHLYTRINLKLIEEYPCLTVSSISSMEQQLNNTLEDEEGVSATELEVAVINRFKELLYRFTECCVPYGEVGDKLNESCELCTFNPNSIDPSSEFANMVLQDGENKDDYEGRFIELKSIESTFSGEHYEDNSLDSLRALPRLNTKFRDDVLRNVGFSAPYPDMDVDILRDLSVIQNTAPAGSVNITVAYFDNANCNSLSTYLANTAITRSGPIVNCPYDYDEELIILRLGGEVRIFSRIRSALPEFDPDVVGNFSGAKAVIIHALIVREILKRAAMGAVNVLVDITFSVVIEKTFGGDPECDGQGPAHSWADAWQDYRTNEFKNKYVAVWKLMVTFAEGAFNVPPFYSAVAAGLADGFKYLFTGSPPPGIDLSDDDSCDAGFKSTKLSGFEIKKFFQIVVKSTVKNFLIDRGLGRLVKWAKQAKTVVSRRPTFVGDAFETDFRGVLMWHAFWDPKLFKTWGVTLTRGLPSTWRTNPDFLKPFAKALDEKPKIDFHLNGHISPQGNAVGCHLTSAIDNIKVQLRNPQPSGFPTYFDPPVNTKLKESYVDIKDANGNWLPKQNKSSFFPDTWTGDKIIEEIAYVRSNPSNKVNDRKWRGLASDGVTEIEVRYTGADINNLTFDTVFPF